MCTRALGLAVAVDQLCQVTWAGHFWAVNPLQTAPLHAHYLCEQLEIQPQRDVAKFQLTFAQEEKELVWTE